VTKIIVFNSKIYRREMANMISNSMLFATFLHGAIDTAVCTPRIGLVVMTWNDTFGIGDSKIARYRRAAHGSSVPISWGRPPDSIE
jgi:hypothetical protein